MVNQVNVNPRMDLTLTTSFFQSRIRGSNAENEDFSNETFSWTINLLSNITIPKWFSLQIMSNYRGPIVLPQGTIDPIFSFNLGFRREVLKKNGTVSLNISDLFNTQRFIINTETPGFDQRRLFNRETRIATLSFTYRFRNFKEQREKIKMDLNGGDDF